MRSIVTDGGCTQYTLHTWVFSCFSHSAFGSTRDAASFRCAHIKSIVTIQPCHHRQILSHSLHTNLNLVALTTFNNIFLCTAEHNILRDGRTDWGVWPHGHRNTSHRLWAQLIRHLRGLWWQWRDFQRHELHPALLRSAGQYPDPGWSWWRAPQERICFTTANAGERGAKKDLTQTHHSHEESLLRCAPLISAKMGKPSSVSSQGLEDEILMSALQVQLQQILAEATLEIQNYE